MNNKNLRFHSEICSFAVITAYVEVGHGKRAAAKAGRVVSGLLVAAAKSGEIGVIRRHNPVTGASTAYVISEEQVEKIRAEAIARAVRS